MVFVQEELSQSHLKSMLRFALGLCSPLTVSKCPLESSEDAQPLFDDIDSLTNEFALETLECVHSFLQKWKRLDLGWSQQLQPLTWLKLSQQDRREFFSLLTSSEEITVEHYEALQRLRQL